MALTLMEQHQKAGGDRQVCGARAVRQLLQQPVPDAGEGSAGLEKKGYRSILLCLPNEGRRLAEDLQEEGLTAFFSEDPERALSPGEIMVTYGNARRGFEYPMQKFVLITESDIFGSQKKKKKRRVERSGQKLNSFAELSIGDYVVHESHGMGIYRGIEKIEVDHTVKDLSRSSTQGGATCMCWPPRWMPCRNTPAADGKSRRSTRSAARSGKNQDRVRAVKDIAADLVPLYAAQDTEGLLSTDRTPSGSGNLRRCSPLRRRRTRQQAIEDTKRDMESDRRSWTA